MIVTVTAKLKLKPTEEQAEAMLQTVFAYRSGCNQVSSVVFRYKLLNLRSLHERTYRQFAARKNPGSIRAQGDGALLGRLLEVWHSETRQPPSQLVFAHPDVQGN